MLSTWTSESGPPPKGASDWHGTGPSPSSPTARRYPASVPGLAPQARPCSRWVSPQTVINWSCRRGEPPAPPLSHRSPCLPHSILTACTRPRPACCSHKSQFTRAALVGEEGSTANDGSSAGFFMLHSHKFLRTAWAAR